jgi:YD repeat-containing protein
MMATVEGRVHTQFGYSRNHGEYEARFQAFDPSSGDPLVATESSTLVSQGSGSGVEEWVEFAPRTVYAGFQNHGSSGRVVAIKLRSLRGQGLGLEWSVTFSLTDGSGDPVGSVGAPACPTGDFDDSETAGSNPAMVDQCGTSRGVADPVDTRTGSISFPLPGIGVDGRGAGLGFGVAYNSSAAWSDSVVGFGWSSVLTMKVAAAGADRVVTQEGGSTVRFGPDGSGGWVAPGRFRASLAAVPGGGWVFTRNHFEVFRFDAAGRVVGLGDQFGNETVVSRDGSGQVVFMEDEAERRLTFSWNAGRVETVSDGVRSVSLDYDQWGDLVSFTDVGGGVWSFEYYSGHRLWKVRRPVHQPSGPQIVNTFDHLGRVVSQVDEAGQRTELNYFTPVPGSTTITFPSGLRRIDHFNAAGVCTGRTLAPGTPLEQVTTWERDEVTLALDEMTNPAGEVTCSTTTGTWQPHDGPDASGRVTRWTYNSFDQVTSVSVGETAAPLTPSTANVVTSTVAYNADGLPTVMVDAVGTAAEATTTFEYDTTHPEDLVAVVDGRGKRWEYDYDPDTGDLLEAVDPRVVVPRWPTTGSAG